MSRRIPLVAIVSLVCWSGAAPAGAADDPREVEGRALFAKGEYRRALDIYASLFAENNDPVFLRNIGRCYQKMRVPDKAIDAFREYVRRSPSLKEAERKEVDGFIAEMEALQRAEAARPPPPAPPPVDLRAPEPAPSPAQSGAAPADAVLVSPPSTDAAAPPVYKRWWFWTAIGVVAAGAVVAVVALGGSQPAVGNCMGVPDCVKVKN